jgi:1,4-dihydroxy-2-naphthoate octaprenyltransferase
MNFFQNWFLASRPWSFTMTAISISVGSALAARDGNFSWGLYVLTLSGIIILHAASNLMNDYYDVLSGVDNLTVSTAKYRPHPLLEGKLKPEQVRNGALLLFGITIILGGYMAATRGWMILFIGMLGVMGGALYTAPPFRYKYHSVGEIGVFLLWGPLMIEGTYFVQRQTFSQEAFWVSLPFGALVALVLLINNVRDISHDQVKKIRTLPILIGQQNGLRLYVILIVLAYFAVLWMSFLGPLSFWSLIVLASLPLAYRLLNQMVREIPTDADARTAQLNTVFGVLLVASLILERWV